MSDLKRYVVSSIELNSFKLIEESTSESKAYCYLKNCKSVKIGDIVAVRSNGRYIDAEEQKVHIMGSAFKKGSKIYSMCNHFDNSPIEAGKKSITDSICYSFTSDGIPIHCTTILDMTNSRKVMQAREQLELKVKKVVSIRRDKIRPLVIAEPTDPYFRLDGGEIFIVPLKFKYDGELRSWYDEPMTRKTILDRVPHISDYNTYIFLDDHKENQCSMHIVDNDVVTTQEGICKSTLKDILKDAGRYSRQLYQSTGEYNPLIIFYNRFNTADIDRSFRTWNLDAIVVKNLNSL